MPDRASFAHTSSVASFALAVVGPSPDGWRIDFHGPHPATARHFLTEGEMAEYAILSRDEGGGHLRYDLGAGAIERRVAEIDRDVAA